MRARPIFGLATLLLLTPLVLCTGVAPSCHAAGFWTNTPLDPLAHSQIGQTCVVTEFSGDVHTSWYDYDARRLMYKGAGGVETVASSTETHVGSFHSMALFAGEVYVAYYDAYNNRLMFATRNGGAWNTQVVDNDGGVGCSLAFNPLTQDPGISYHTSSSATNVVKYAWYDNGWQKQTVDAGGGYHETSLVMDLNGPYRPRIAYGQRISSSSRHLKYAEWDGSSWLVETVDDQLMSGDFVSLKMGAMNADSPGIAYTRSWNPGTGEVTQVRYARKTSLAPVIWEKETVDTGGDGCELALRRVDPPWDIRPMIAYRSDDPSSTSRLRFAEWSGSLWFTMDVGEVRQGYEASMVLHPSGPAGWPVITHVNQSDTPVSGGQVYLARWTDCPDMTAPTLVGPSGTCVATTALLSWDPVLGATSYEVQLGGSCGTGAVQTTSETSLQVSGLTENAEYEWRVRAQNTCGTWGPWSSCMPFLTTPGLPEPTVLTAPINGATGIATDGVQLQWIAPSGAAHFEFQFGTACGSGSIVPSAFPTGGASGLAVAETYYWRARSQNACGEWGAWSDCSSFTTYNTPTGTDVTVDPIPEISLGFDEITGAGDTTVDTSAENPGPDVNAYMFMGTFYDINTTATYTGEVEVCLDYDDTGMVVQQELGLRLFHLVAGSWVDITSSVDTDANVICGLTTTLSPFGAALFMPWMPDGTTPALAMTDDTVGVSWGDYDDDGDPDLYVVNHAQPDKMFRNDGSGVFTNVTAAPLGHAGQGSVGCWADYDNDGDRDLYLTVRGGANVLYKNDNGVFVDATTAPLNDSGESHGAAWFDYDLDGDLDVYVSNYTEANRLYRNDGGGAFTDVSGAPIDHTGQTSGAAIADYDDDGDPDIYITNTGAQPNRLFRNDGGGAWTDITPGSLSIVTESRGAAWGDYDNDGDLDLYVANGAGANQLFRNDGGNVFADISSGVLANVGSGRGAGWQDYDNDGDLDLYIANLNSANMLVRNEGWGIFTDGTITPLDDAGYGIGAAWADYDMDGDPDLYLGNAFGPNVLFRNDQVSTNHWLHVRLSGVSSNRDGIGARVRVVAGALDQIREVHCGAGYVSQASLTAEFGLGLNPVVDLIEVYWPSGTVTSIASGIGIDRAITVAEGATGTPDLPGVTRLHQPKPNPFNPRTTVSFDIAVAGPVFLRVYDSAGRLVRTILNGAPYEPGIYHEVWTGKDQNGSSVASGVYHVRFEAPGKVETKSVTLIR